MIDPLIKDSFLEVGRRSPWVCVMMCHVNSHGVIVNHKVHRRLRHSHILTLERSQHSIWDRSELDSWDRSQVSTWERSELETTESTTY